MSLDDIQATFLKHELATAFEHVAQASPYTLSIIEKYPPDVERFLASGVWTRPLDYSDPGPGHFPLLDKLKHATSDQDCKSILRRFRNLHSARILWHDLNGLADWQTVFKAQSGLADLCVRATLTYLEKEFANKYHPPSYANESPLQLAVIAMGKWGGEELNFSSDIDFVLLYAESGEAQGKDSRRAIEHHQYFTKLAQRLIQILDDITADGFAFRCDTRLRPFGDSGALVVSLAALEQYLTRHGREWERYAYLKARCVTGDAQIQSDFEDLRRPFVYRRYLDYGVFAKLREMHQQIAEQVKKNELKDNIKLGRGGIRECEFLIQALQLLRGGRERSLQAANFYTAYRALLKAEVWQDPEQKLLDAYAYLRLLENRLQGLHQQQTHELPEDEGDQMRLSVAMNTASWSELLNELNTHRQNVQSIFNEQLSLLTVSDAESAQDPVRWQNLIQESSVFPESVKHSFQSLEKSRYYQNFTESAQTTLDNLLKHYLIDVQKRVNEQGLDEPTTTRASENFLSVIHAIGKRTVYYDLLVERPAALTHLIDVCVASDFLCQQIAQWPILLDELLDARLFTQVPERVDIQKATQQVVANSKPDDSEGFINDLVVHKQVQSFRIAMAEIFKRLPLMKVSDRLSDVAELILEVVFERVLRQTLDKFELPPLLPQESGFSILAYGKLGGLELSYRSDLDLVFLYDKEALPGAHPLRQDKSLRTRFYLRLVQQCLRFLNLPTSMGRLYEIDTRLRPSGNSGFLVSSLPAFTKYQSEEAWVWEHQALTRARVVLGSDVSRHKIAEIRAQILSAAVEHTKLREEVISMRERMRQEFQKKHREAKEFHLKQSPGGMIDLEFLVQYLVLENAQSHPEVIEYSDNIRQLEALAVVGALSQNIAQALIDAYISLREKVHLLTLQSKKPLLAASEKCNERDVIKAQWDRFLA